MYNVVEAEPYELWLSIYYPNGKVDRVVVRVPKEVKMSPILSHRAIEIGFCWHKGITQEQFVEMCRDTVASIGFGQGRVCSVESETTQYDKHRNFMKSLFPNSARDFIIYIDHTDIKEEIQDWYKSRE